jgi:hypothetical protein
MRFADMKRILELNRLCLRGLSGTTVEVPLTATAQNTGRLPLTPALRGGNQVGLVTLNNYLRDRSRCLETFRQCRRSSRMLAKKHLLSLRPRLFTSRREKTSQGLSTRKHQGNQLQHPARRSHRLPERHRQDRPPRPPMPLPTPAEIPAPLH